MNDPTSEAPIVLLHAYPLDSRMWDAQKAALGGRRVLTPDFPGFGTVPPGPESLAEFAGHVEREMDAAGISSAIIVGLSMGGYVAFRLWESHPERVAALVLADTRAGPDGAEAAARRADQAERARREGLEWLPDAMLEPVLGESTRRDRPDIAVTVGEMMLDASPEGVARALLAMRARPDSRPLLPTIDVPTLVVVGEEDRVTDAAEARTIAEGVPGAELVTIPHAGHLSNLENPEAFNDALLRFLARLRW